MSKRIECIMPVDWVTGNLSGRQFLTYTDEHGRGWTVPDGQSIAANGYQPRLIAKRVATTNRRYFQVRTRTSVHMTAAQRLNLAVMGGAGALYSSMLRHKDAPIYNACVAACPRKMSLRQFVYPALLAGLRDKLASLAIAEGVEIVNPWVSAAEPNVPISATMHNKFAAQLSV
jgi:hypothetical protein